MKADIDRLYEAIQTTTAAFFDAFLMDESLRNYAIEDLRLQYWCNANRHRESYGFPFLIFGRSCLSVTAAARFYETGADGYEFPGDVDPRNFVDEYYRDLRWPKDAMSYKCDDYILLCYEQGIGLPRWLFLDQEKEISYSDDVRFDYELD